MSRGQQRELKAIEEDTSEVGGAQYSSVASFLAPPVDLSLGSEPVELGPAEVDEPARHPDDPKPKSRHYRSQKRKSDELSRNWRPPNYWVTNSRRL